MFFFIFLNQILESFPILDLILDSFPILELIPDSFLILARGWQRKKSREIITKITKGQKVQGKISQWAKKIKIKINWGYPKKTCPWSSFTQLLEIRSPVPDTLSSTSQTSILILIQENITLRMTLTTKFIFSLNFSILSLITNVWMYRYNNKHNSCVFPYKICRYIR